MMIKNFALILDRSQCSLNKDANQFHQRVTEMCEIMRNRGTPDFAKFFDLYGTHYPYATVYGGAAYLDVTFTENSWKSSYGGGVSYEASAKADLFGLSAGAHTSASLNTEFGADGLSSNKQSRFKTYGGCAAKGDGFSCPPGEEVPIQMDMRPMHDLLSPAFFDDPYVWKTLRPAWIDAYRKYVNTKVDAYKPVWVYTPGKPANWSPKPMK